MHFDYFQGHWRNSTWSFTAQKGLFLKKKWWSSKNHAVFLGIGFWFQNCQGLQHIFPEFKRVDFASFFVWYFQGAVANLEIPRVYSKNISSTPPCLGFSGKAHVSIFSERAYINSSFNGKLNPWFPTIELHSTLSLLPWKWSRTSENTSS